LPGRRLVPLARSGYLRWALILVAAVAAGGCKRAERSSALPPERSAASARVAADAAGEPAAAPPPRGPVSTELGQVPAELAERVALTRVAGGFRRPLALEVAPGDDSGRLFVVEQGGKIWPIRGEKVAARPLLDIRSRVSRGHNEQGLLGLAFHPAFATNRRFFVNFTDRRGATRVLEYRASKSDPEQLAGGEPRQWLEIEQPWGNHNGGGLEFGPDGKLYVGTGDGGAAGDPLNSGQDPKSLLGKMLRLDVDGGEAGPEIVQLGLRNPWRYDFDRETGDLYIGDVGQDRWEWVNVVAAAKIDGVNFGWNVTEGSRCFRARDCDAERFTPPAIEYDHQTGCSITGGEVYRGRAIPALRGHYFYADFCTAIIRSFRWDPDGVRDHGDWKPVLDPDFRLAQIASFGHDAAGELYLVSLAGPIYKIVPKP
jgi:glucose/arabinose dehydrogenase